MCSGPRDSPGVPVPAPGLKNPPGPRGALVPSLLSAGPALPTRGLSPAPSTATRRPPPPPAPAPWVSGRLSRA